MEQSKIYRTKEKFDSIVNQTENEFIDYWYARDLMPLLGYERWENFHKAIQRAMNSVETSDTKVSDHFRGVTKMVPFNYPFFMEKYKLKTIADEAMVKEEYLNLVG
ncbi:hypothetical protein [Streptococcus suis]|uniref:hypothetical protein n=1 Tax=Streptococcus suis TaxID=1307 RepID=UPI0021BBEB02|nr:hypothetical protein [Streptococcus suis]